ncbi:hypothetical protein ACFQ7A_14155 [Streptomyces sp. NPDC056528]|uniref:hypothetical protein n=1 Tax=Streptomyces sp. NPDC056528 TaxID=3345854 RepID=UPI0036ABA689
MQTTVAREGVHPWQFGLVLLAVITPLIPLLSWTDEGYVGLFPVLATVGLTAVPLLLHARPQAFGRCAGLVAAPLLVWSFVGAMIGMFLFLPSALQLLLAAGADPRRRPTAAGAMAGAGLALSAVVLARFWSE